MNFISMFFSFVFAIQSPRHIEVDVDGGYRGKVGRVVSPPRCTVGTPCQCG